MGDPVNRAGRFGRLLLAAVLLLAASLARADVPWPQLAGGGHILLIRHASTEPGNGDPPGFRLDDCVTQRNLSAAGRRETRRLGAGFRVHGVPLAAVRSSPWCRCLETAALAFGDATTWPALSSLYGDASQTEARSRAVIDAARQLPAGRNLVLVTHAVNIRALTGVSPAPGEVIVTRLAGDRLESLGRLAAWP